MAQVCGKPVLEWNIEWLRSQGVARLVVNLHQHAQVVTDYFGDGRDFGVAIRYSYEPELMGTSGALWAARRLLTPEPFLVLYADNLINCNLGSFRALHESRGALLTMALFRRQDVSASGVVLTDDRGRIIAFQEKPRPEEALSHWVNAGLFLCQPRVMSQIPPGRPSDFGREVLPAMLAAGEPLYGYPLGAGDTLKWIDTPEDLAYTRAALARLLHGLPSAANPPRNDVMTDSAKPKI
jgi:NDP-sugar pyrophosphorylase family protein